MRRDLEHAREDILEKLYEAKIVVKNEGPTTLYTYEGEGYEAWICELDHNVIIEAAPNGDDCESWIEYVIYDARDKRFCTHALSAESFYVGHVIGMQELCKS